VRSVFSAVSNRASAWRARSARFALGRDDTRASAASSAARSSLPSRHPDRRHPMTRRQAPCATCSSSVDDDSRRMRAFRCAAQPVEHLHRLLALCPRLGELLFRLAALPSTASKLLLGGPPREQCGGATAAVSLSRS